MKAVEEADSKMEVALVAAEAVDKAVVDTKDVAASKAVDAATVMTTMVASKAVDAATVMATMVAVVKVITMEIKARIMEAPHKDLTIKATGAATTTYTRLWYSPYNKVTRPAQAFTTLL